MASVLHNVGGLAHARGDYQAAEATARRAVEIRTWALGPEHIHVAADRAALAIFERALDPTPPEPRPLPRNHAHVLAMAATRPRA